MPLNNSSKISFFPVLYAPAVFSIHSSFETVKLACLFTDERRSLINRDTLLFCFFAYCLINFLCSDEINIVSFSCIFTFRTNLLFYTKQFYFIKCLHLQWSVKSIKKRKILAFIRISSRIALHLRKI